MMEQTAKELAEYLYDKQDHFLDYAYDDDWYNGETWQAGERYTSLDTTALAKLIQKYFTELNDSTSL